MLDLDQAIRERHSTRMFLPQPVPRELVNEALALAQDAPSNSNIQPWHMVFASGASRDRLVAALLDEAKRRPPNIPPLPASTLCIAAIDAWNRIAISFRAVHPIHWKGAA
jgi:nitroreductase